MRYALYINIHFYYDMVELVKISIKMLSSTLDIGRAAHNHTLIYVYMYMMIVFDNGLCVFCYT